MAQLYKVSYYANKHDERPTDISIRADDVTLNEGCVHFTLNRVDCDETVCVISVAKLVSVMGEQFT